MIELRVYENESTRAVAAVKNWPRFLRVVAATDPVWQRVLNGGRVILSLPIDRRAGRLVKCIRDIMNCDRPRKTGRLALVDSESLRVCFEAKTWHGLASVSGINVSKLFKGQQTGILVHGCLVVGLDG